MELKNKQIEKIEKVGKPKVMGVMNCKTFRKALQTLIGQHFKKGNKELEVYTIGLLNLYNKFHPEQIVEVKANQWKHKSSFQIIKEIDKLIIIKYQRPSEKEEPVEIRTEVSKEEIDSLVDAIKYCSKYEPEIKTKHLAMAFSMGLKLCHSNWKEFFADRVWHNKLTLMLNAFQEMGLIEYVGGKTKLLNKNISVQLIL